MRLSSFILLELAQCLFVVRAFRLTVDLLPFFERAPFVVTPKSLVDSCNLAEFCVVIMTAAHVCHDDVRRVITEGLDGA